MLLSVSLIGFSGFRIYVEVLQVPNIASNFQLYCDFHPLIWQKNIQKQTNRKKEKQSILLSRRSTAVNDCGHGAHLEIKKRVLRLSFTFELRGELSNSMYPSHFNECKTSDILLS